MQELDEIKVKWMYPLKKKILLGILGILTLSIMAAMVFIVLMVRTSLINDSKIKAQELADAIKSNLRSLMLMRNPYVMQDTFDSIGKSTDSIVKAFILDRTGRIAFSTDRTEIGKVLDRHGEKSCQGCHQKLDAAPSENTIITMSSGIKVHRNVKVIYNEEACYGCHSKSDRINGKLIIDHSLKHTYSLITSIELIVFGSGIVCLIFLIPFLSRKIDKYIVEIISQNDELTLLYTMVNRLSKTIDLEELKHIVADILADTLGADEVDLILPKDNRGYRVFTMLAGKDKITRKKVNRDDPMLLVINDWLNSGFDRENISKDGKQVYMPIAKGDTRLALISVRKVDGTFDPQRLRLIRAISGHISIAFENARLYHIAITDELTHLYTPRHFRYCINREFSYFEKYGEKITLLMLDIDDFKKINDTYGHTVGDSVLKGVAQCILSSIRDNDLAFRYGGEEFTVFLPSTDASGGRIVAERTRENIETSVFEKGTHNLKVTISIGVSTCPDNAHTAKDLILTADRALYKAKETGKNKVIVSSEE